MKVVMLSHEYPPYIFGGIGGFLKNLASGLLELGVDVTVVSGIPGSFCKSKVTKEVIDRVKVIRLSYPNLPPHHVMFQLQNYKKIQKIIIQEKPDVIHGQSGSTFPAVLGLKKLAPILMTIHASPLMEKETSAKSIFHGGSMKDFWTYVLGYPSETFVYSKELEHSDLSVAVSKTLRNELLREMGQDNSNKIRSIYNGVNLKKLDKDYNLTKNQVDQSENTILFAGRLYWRKGALNLIKFAHLLKLNKSKFKIIVHGVGPLYRSLQLAIKNLNLTNMHLKGFTTRNELMKSLRESKFVAVPSFYDACPMTLLNCMCLGKIPLMLSYPFALELSGGGKYGIIGNSVENLTKKLLSNNEETGFHNSIMQFARKKYAVNETSKQYYQIYRELSV